VVGFAMNGLGRTAVAVVGRVTGEAANGLGLPVANGLSSARLLPPPPAAAHAKGLESPSMEANGFEGERFGCIAMPPIAPCMLATSTPTPTSAAPTPPLDTSVPSPPPKPLAGISSGTGI
jgi:hypothetical protein